MRDMLESSHLTYLTHPVIEALGHNSGRYQKNPVGSRTESAAQHLSFIFYLLSFIFYLLSFIFYLICKLSDLLTF